MLLSELLSAESQILIYMFAQNHTVLLKNPKYHHRKSESVQPRVQIKMKHPEQSSTEWLNQAKSSQLL